ncbi:MAG: NAD-dependent epimerase/dehydratase family protein [Dethiobacteraceae bacterium]|jgi:UDP-glucuronate decarboxylase
MFMKNPYYQQDLKQITEYKIPFNELQNKSVLITGCNGLIASYLIDSLMWLNLHYNYNIKIYALCRNLNNAKTRFSSNCQNHLLRFVIQDVCAPITIEEDVDYIIHAASNSHPTAFSTDPVGTIQANILGTINLCEFARKQKGSRLMFVSSGEVYGENSSISNGFREESFGFIDTMNARSCYPEGKRAAESICASYAKQYDLNVVVVRPCYVYGATITNNNSRADAQFLRNVLEGNDIVMKSKGTQYRSYCYVADAVTAFFTVLLLGKAGEAYNIANKNSKATILEYAKTLAHYGNVSVKFELPSETERQGYSVVKRSILDATKLEALCWLPQFTLDEGLKRTVLILNAQKV